MQKVVTVNLNGNAYQLDESAYDALRAYLDRAGVQLKDNPDRTEILTDLEQAIAEKCGKFLGPTKTVVSADEMQRIVAEMGPVEGDNRPSADGAASQSRDTPNPEQRGPKRLYRIREGAMWAGVCTGLAAFFGIDVVIVRILFAIVAAVSFGWGILGYWALVFIVPEAQTSDEFAAARGQTPSNAQHIVDQAKKTAADVGNTLGSTTREWKRQWRLRREHRRTWSPWGAVPPGAYRPVSPAALMPLFGIVTAACAVTLVVAIASVLNTGRLFGWPLPSGMPAWAAILILIVVFQFLTAPIRMARHFSYGGWAGYHPWVGMWNGLIGTAVTVLFIWLLARHMTPVHDAREFFQQFPLALRAVIRDVEMWFRATFS